MLSSFFGPGLLLFTARTLSDKKVQFRPSVVLGFVLFIEGFGMMWRFKDSESQVQGSPCKGFLLTDDGWKVDANEIRGDVSLCSTRQASLFNSFKLCFRAYPKYFVLNARELSA